jgi:hypothetical protein
MRNKTSHRSTDGDLLSAYGQMNVDRGLRRPNAISMSGFAVVVDSNKELDIFEAQT